MLSTVNIVELKEAEKEPGFSIKFLPESEEFIEAAQEYGNIWEKDG